MRWIRGRGITWSEGEGPVVVLTSARMYSGSGEEEIRLGLGGWSGSSSSSLSEF